MEKEKFKARILIIYPAENLRKDELAVHRHVADVHISGVAKLFNVQVHTTLLVEPYESISEMTSADQIKSFVDKVELEKLNIPKIEKKYLENLFSEVANHLRPHVFAIDCFFQKFPYKVDL